MQGIKRRLFLSAACVAAIGGLAQQARAQTEPTGKPQAESETEIVVTARRRAETLKDVPISLSVKTADQLAQEGSSTLVDLQRSVPNVTLQPSRGTNSTLTSYIRGIGQQDPLWGFENGVGLYVDEVYIARPQGAVLDIFDVSRIEVLRGPQGTLYGRNTIGGAIKFVSAELAADPQLRIRGELGTYDEANLIVSGSAPVGESLRVGGAVARYSRSGYGTNLYTGADTANKNVWAGRVSAELRPASSLFFRLSYDLLVDDSNGNYGHRQLPGLPGDPPNPPNVYDTNAGIGDTNHIRNEGGSLLARWDVSPELQLKSITAYRRNRSYGSGIDFDGNPMAYLDIGGTGYRDREFSQEVQAVYSGSKLQGILGAYYLDATASGGYESRLILAAPGGYSNDVSGSVKTKSYALFGDFTYALTDRLSLSAGLRYTKEDRQGTVFNANYLGLYGPQSGANPPLLAVVTDYTASRSDDAFSPRASLSFKITPDVTAYASFSRGFKSGGFDPRGNASVYPQTKQGFGPEYVSSYELGLKGSAFDRRLSFNIAAFKNDYTDRQVTTIVVLPAPMVGTASIVQNAASSKIDGVEVEGQLHIVRTPSDKLWSGFSYGHLNARFDEFVSYDVLTKQYVNIADTQRFEGTPSDTYSVALNYLHDFGDAGSLFLNVSRSWRGSYSIFQTANALTDQSAYALFDAGIAWTSQDGNWRLAVYGRNLTDERYRTGAYVFPGALFGNSVNSFYGPPRTVRFSIERRF